MNLHSAGRTLLTILGVALLVGFSASCFRPDTESVTIHVPEMQSERDVRIITNAVLYEIVGRPGGPVQQNFRTQIDLPQQYVMHHASSQMISGRYRAELAAQMKAAGYESSLLTTGRNPDKTFRPNPAEPPVNTWPGRHSAVFKVPEMRTVSDANKVHHALSRVYTEMGIGLLEIDPAARKIHIRDYPARRTAIRNLEAAIANVGYAANDMPPYMGLPAAERKGWLSEPILLQKRPSS